MMMRWIFPGGKLKREIKSITLSSDTAKTETLTVPSAKRWLILSIKVENPDDVARTISIHVKDSSGNILESLATGVSLNAGGRYQWPHTGSASAYSAPFHLVILEEGEKLEINWASGGASSGGTDSDALVVNYLEVDH